MKKVSNYLFKKEADPDDFKGVAYWSQEKWLTLLSAFALFGAAIYSIRNEILFQGEDSQPVTCLLRLLTGFYCPGCGATHALIYFFRLQWPKSFGSHAGIFLILVTLLPFTFVNLLHLLSKERIWGLRFHLAYLWFYVAAMFLNFLGQNLYMVIVFGNPFWTSPLYQLILKLQ